MVEADTPRDWECNGDGRGADGQAGQDQLAWAFSFPSIDGGRWISPHSKAGCCWWPTPPASVAIPINMRVWRSCITAKSAAGLTVVGVPSQDFNQESADNATVKTFCETRFGIDFPLTAVSHVAARRRHRSMPG